MNKKMSFIPSVFKALALVVCLMWNFLSHAGPLNTPIFSVSFSPTTIGPGSVSTMTYTIDNSAQATAVSGLTFTNTLPAGMTIASPAVALNTCLNGSDVSTPGSSVISFSDYRLGAGASCSFQVDVTSTTAGAHINTTGALSTSAGSAGTSSDTLTVDDNRPGFSMAFSPATITPGAISTLTYTIDNSANSSNTNFQSFTHSLPTGLIFSQQPNITNSCSATVVAEPSSSTLTSAGAAVSAGATCTISVDVTAPSAGVYQTKSIGLSRFGSNPSGQGSAELTVGSSFMFMTFPNASAPGTTVDLTYTINNVDRVNAAENISFTNELNATLSGLTATALPADGFCGVGSSLTIPSPITVTGANLSAGASCTFKISVLIPAGAAAGSYTNTTSVINLTLGSATTKAAATNTLAIKKAPQVSMSFLNNPVNSGENLTLRYVVTNTDTTNSATNLGFTMPINSIVSGMVTNTLPTANTCGVGSTFSDSTDDGSTRYFAFADGTIPAGGSCTFDLVLTLPAGNSSANYLLTTSTIAGTVNGDTVYGNQAQETLAVMSAAKLSLAIVEEQIVPGGQVTLEFTLDYSESAAADVSNLAFTVDLNTVLSGLTAVSTPSGDVCGAGSTISGSSILTFSSGSLSSASQCTFSVTLSVPNNATPSIITLTSSAVTGSSVGQAVNSAAASDTLVISALHLTKSFSPDVVLAGDIISLTYTLTNSSADATQISFTDSMSSVINSFAAITLPTDPCGVGSSITGTTSLTFAGGNLDSGASCTFIVALQVPAGAADGVYNSVTSNVNGTVNGSNTYSVAATATLEVQSLTALLTSTAGNPTASSPILVNINFSRDVVNFTVNDLVVNNATLANFSGSGNSYQVDLTPSSNGEVTVDLPANSVDDLVDNNVTNSSSNQLSLVYNNNAFISVLVPVANVQVQGSNFNISGTSPTEGMVIYLYSDNNNDGVVDNNTALASTSVNGGSWTLDAPVTLGNANNFLVGNQTTRAIEVIDIPTITELTNFVPVISGLPGNVAVEDSVYIFTPTVTDTNSSDVQTFSITNKPNWATFSTTTGALTGTPTNADVGTTSGIVISVADAANATVSLAAFNLTVTNTNDAPVITGTPATTVAEDAAYSFIPTVSDVDAGDTQTFSINIKPSWATFSTSTGGLTGTPTNADVGITSGIIISVADAANASVSLAAFNLTVSNTNDAPVITGTPATTVAEDAAYSFIPTVSDVDAGDTQTFSITNIPSWATFNTLTGALTGTPSRTDAADYAGIVIIVTDNASTIGTLPTFTITVTNSNEAPVADAQTLILEEDSELSIILSAEDPDGDELTYAIVTEPEHGSLVQSPNNIWVYTADKDFNGTDNFTYKALDAETDSEPVTVELTINPVNDTPVAQDDNIELTYSESGRYNLDVLNNDSDVDGDVLSIINASSAIGNASIEAGELIFQIQGVFEGEIKLQYAISDGNAVIDNDNSKANVTLVFDNHIDALLPVITLPQDIEINATALFTKVDLGVATAINSEGASVPVSLVDGVTRFAPGNNLVYWQAQDSDGFKRVVTQRVTVQPLVNIAVDSQGTEGEHYKVAVHLNGESPTYPVIVPYSISGDSDSNDHDLVSGELIIDSGLLGYIEFDTFSDGVVEADEVVIITLDDSVNVGAKSVFTLTITEDNLAPQASITVSQNNEQRTLIDKTLGEVVITSDVFDANNDDNHSYTWISVGGVLVDSDSEDTSFTFDPTNVATGQQTLSLNVTDNGESSLSTVVFVYLDIVEALPTLTDIDSDGDLTPDNAEGYGDTDNDGIADYLDNNNSRCNIQTSEISEQELYLIETEPSICLRRGINTANNQSGALLLSVNEVINDNEAINVGGFFDFILSGLPIAGQSISLVLPQRLPIPENAIYRKLTSDNGWGEFAVDTNNYYSSAAGEIGYCPAPNDDSWTLGLTAGHWCVQLTIEDGGLNDDDGIANSRIVDPSGVAVFNNNNTLPEIMSEQVVTTQNKSVTIDVLANDIDSDGDSLSITSANVDFGNVTIVGQQLYYQPDANFFGLATIVYGVSDSNNGIGFGDVTVNVIENTAPVTVDDSATTDDRTAITIDVLANDTDVDNDELTLLSVSAEQGSIIISNNMLVYTPLAGFNGVETVTYHISDNNGGESQGQVVVTVNAYETIIITNKSSGGSFGVIILLLGSVMLFIRRKSTLVMSKTATGKTLVQGLSLWVLLSLSSLSFSSYAAQAPKFDIFIKAELGQGKAKTSGISKQVPVGVITQIDNKATSWSIGVGANITKDWSVTLSYVDMGEGSLAITGDTLIASKYHQSVAKIVPVLVKGIGLNGHYHFLQSDQYNASVLFGLLTWHSDVVSAYEDQRIDHDNDGIDMYYGIEGTYKIDEAWGVNAGIKRYALDVNDVDIAYLGLTYDF